MYNHILILLSMSLLMKSSFSLKHCQTRTCNGLTIQRPFWIPGLQDPDCGSTGFNITCDENRPLIRINGTGFIIIDIFYKNASFLLAQSRVWDPDVACVAPQRNFSVVGTPFTYGPATTDLYFLYNCTTPYDRETYDVGCASNATGHYSFAVFHLELLEHWNYSAQSCRDPVNAAVEADDVGRLLNMTYAEILKKGFVLQWDGCHGCHSGTGLNFEHKVSIGIGAAAVITLIMCIIFSIYHHKYKKHHATSSQETSPYPSMSKDLEKAGVHIFHYYELDQATDHFNPKRELGDGGYGAVFKGKLKDGRDVAVKRLYEHHFRRIEQFINEVEIVARLRHKNLVTLYGCTACHSRELLLVYEYIPRGTLADHLHGQRAEPAGALSWRCRLSIAIETAAALAYLHSLGVVHRDVKSSNILIDNSFSAKVADFGLSRLLPVNATHASTGPQGTPGYVDPEYNELYRLTEKSDVYSFGVVLIELISSKPAIDLSRKREEISLSSMAVKKIQDQAVVDLVDPNLGFESDEKVRRMILGVAELAFRCLQIGRDLRPHMEDVVNVLKEIQSIDVMDHIPADYAQMLENE